MGATVLFDNGSHRNVLFDLFILLETAEIIFWRRGAR